MDTDFSNLNATDFSNLPYSNKTLRIADVERNRLLVLQPEEISIYNLNPEFDLFNFHDKNKTSLVNKSYSSSNCNSNQPQTNSTDKNLFHLVEVWYPDTINFDETKLDFKHELDSGEKFKNVLLKVPCWQTDFASIKKMLYCNLVSKIENCNFFCFYVK